MAEEGMRSNSPQIQRNSAGLCEKPADQEKKDIKAELSVLSPRDCYTDCHPMNPTEFEGITEGVTIPEYFPLSIHPFPHVFKNDMEAYMAAYIFIADDENRHGEEILAQSELGVVGYRKTLKTLMPDSPVDQAVINLVCCKLTHQQRCGGTPSLWYLPANFAQHALDWMHNPKADMEFFQNAFMGRIEDVRKIFIPMNDQGLHWYLMVVDFIERKLYVLDSAPCAERKLLRHRDVLRMSIFLEEMFMENSYYDCGINLEKRIISNFSVVEPRGLLSQRYGSNDSGVWVAAWMKECDKKNDYNCVEVYPDTRVKLAIDLVHSIYNIKMNKITEKACEHWKNVQEKKDSTLKWWMDLQKIT